MSVSIPSFPSPRGPRILRAQPHQVTAVEFELLPGDVALGRQGDELRTLLGSCVAVLLVDPKGTIGTMCHIVHAGEAPPTSLRDTAFGGRAMAAMASLLRSVGVTPQLCEAHVFGGGNMFPGQFQRGPHVGARNADWALAFLDGHGIVVKSQDVGGSGYRRLRWVVGDGPPQVVMNAISA